MSKKVTNITVAIPFYNDSKFLGSAIESVINQTYKNWELLLVNDGSKDNSLEIAQRYQALDARIKIINDGVNKGLAKRLNEIPHLCNTEYLVRMDSDDIMHPLKLEKQIKIIKENDIDVLGTNAYSIDENNEVIGIRYPPNDTLITTVTGFIHPTIMAKTSWFIDNPYDEKAIRIEDADLWFRTNSKFNFMRINEPLFFYREISGNYYKKYYKALPSIFYLIKKHNFNFYWLKKFITNASCIGIYYLFEKILKNNFLIRRRNKVIFSIKKNIDDLILKKHFK